MCLRRPCSFTSSTSTISYSAFALASLHPSLFYPQAATEEFRVSSKEKAPTTRALSGSHWQHYQVQKVLQGVFPDGKRRVLLLLVATAIGIYSSWTVLRSVRCRERNITALRHCHYYPPTCYRHSAMFNIATHSAMITMATHLRHGQHCNLSARSGSLAGAHDPPPDLPPTGRGHVPV